MKYIKFIFLALLTMSSIQAKAQKKQHKIVFAFTNAQDTLQQKAFTKQLQNLREHWPKAKIEVVVYNNGIDYLMSSKSKHIAAIKDLKAKDISFIVCENTMKQRKVQASELLPEAQIIPAGIAEIVEKQEMGWSYIKGGF
jgi:intracellular sulfur oxidation DsrE/DsrF family protein